MPGPFNYLGLSTLGYPSYADTDTGRMLVADPGGSYGIRAIEDGAVPPPDGRWATPSSGKKTTPPPGVPPVPAVPAVEGSDN